MKRIPFWTALIALLLTIALLSPALAENTTPKRGDVITMGTYEQDGNTKNGAEPIEWMVLDEKDDRLLVISVKALETMAYDDTYSFSSHIWWENCSLRKWLNKDFLSTAFSAGEQKNILSTKLTTKDKHGTFETKDQLFCLSLAELRQYFPTNESMMCEGTKVAQKANNSVGESGNVNWWLRNILVEYASDIRYLDSAAFVQASPLYDINSDGCPLWASEVTAVRPAMWIRRDSVVVSSNVDSELQNLISSDAAKTVADAEALKGEFQLDIAAAKKIGDKFASGSFEGADKCSSTEGSAAYVFYVQDYDWKNGELDIRCWLGKEKGIDDIKAYVNIDYTIPYGSKLWNSKPNIIVISANGITYTLPDSMWSWSAGTAKIKISNDVRLFKKLANANDFSITMSNVNPATLTFGTFGKKSPGLKGIKTAWEIWNAANCDELMEMKNFR